MTVAGADGDDTRGSTGGSPSAAGVEPLLRRGQLVERGPITAAVRRVWQVADVRTRQVVALGAIAFVGGAAEAVALLIVVRVGVAVAGGDDTVQLGRVGSDLSIGTVVAIGLAIVLVRTLLFVWAGRLWSSIAASTLLRLRTAVLGAFLDASWSLQSVEREGRLQELLSTHVGRISSGVATVAGGFTTLLGLGALLISAIVISPVTALAGLAAIVVLGVALLPVSRLSRQRSRQYASANLSFVESVHESVDLALEARTFGVEDAQRQRANRRAERASRVFVQNLFLGRLVPGLYEGAALALLLLGLLAVSAVDPDRVRTFGPAVAILVRALASSRDLQTAYHQVNDVVPYVDQLLDQLGRYRAMAVGRSGQPLPNVERLSMSAISFSYGRDRPALDRVDFTVGAGEAVGLVGPSGSGKSTLVQILLRLRDPDGGTYVANGVPAADIDLADWTRRIAFVPQDVHLPRGSIADAVRFRREWIDDSTVVDALARAGLRDEIDALPDGIHTELGPRGVGLSGGQQQRVAVARALAGAPDVLVLDEPTSSLDARSEAALQATLRELRGRVALVVIAHRLSTLAVCDRLVVLERGRVQAAGSPDDVLASSDYYRDARELWQLQ